MAGGCAGGVGACYAAGQVLAWRLGDAQGLGQGWERVCAGRSRQRGHRRVHQVAGQVPAWTYGVVLRIKDSGQGGGRVGAVRPALRTPAHAPSRQVPVLISACRAGGGVGGRVCADLVGSEMLRHAPHCRPGTWIDKGVVGFGAGTGLCQCWFWGAVDTAACTLVCVAACRSLQQC